VTASPVNDENEEDPRYADVVVIGGGQAGLAVGYHLRRTGLSFVILDAEDGPGGAWRHAWRSLRLFSPAAWSSLPGWLLTGGETTYPSRDDVLDYLARYEARYRLPVRRPVMVRSVERAEDSRLRVVTDQGDWTTERPPVFLPDDVDGRVLFHRATERIKTLQEGREPAMPTGGLGDIVMVPPVVEARERGVLHAVRQFTHFTETGVVWRDGTESPVDAVIWRTGFRPALHPVAGLGLIGLDGTVELDGTRSVREPRLWFVGYGGWSGPASATLIGVGRSARETARRIAEDLGATGGGRNGAATAHG
jgi:putative flavoprotein involved in K+ transport